MLLLFLACLSAGTKRDIVIVKVITNTMPWGFPPSQSNNKIKKVISYKYNFIFFNPFSSSAYHTLYLDCATSPLLLSKASYFVGKKFGRHKDMVKPYFVGGEYR